MSIEGNSRLYLSLEVYKEASGYKVHLSNGNTILLGFNYRPIDAEMPSPIVAKQIMTCLWLHYATKCANDKHPLENACFEAWWRLECYQRLHVNVDHPRQLVDEVAFCNGYVDLLKSRYVAVYGVKGPFPENVVIPFGLKMGTLPRYESLVGIE